MKGQGYRHGYLAAGVFAVSVFAFGWTTQWAPARDANTPKVEKHWLSEEQQSQQGQAIVEEIHAAGLPQIVQEELERPQPLIRPVKSERGTGWITTETDTRTRFRTRLEGSPVSGTSAFATGGTMGPGGMCTCDSDCGASTCSISGVACTGAPLIGTCPAGNLCTVGTAQCHVSHCVGGVCAQDFAPVDTVCNFDGVTPLFCTEDRCDAGGVCIDSRAKTTVPPSGPRLSPCSKQCCLNATCAGQCSNSGAPCVVGGPVVCPALEICTVGSALNCTEPGDCPSAEGCFPKRQLDGGVTYVADCNETLNQCFVETLTANNVPVGRCCTAGVCSETTAANCAGNWWRWTDPDDSLHACDTTMGCPAYSSGIAPVDLPASQVNIGKVVPYASRCFIGGNLCENSSDCISRCAGGLNLNEACSTDNPDCPIMGGGFAMCLPIDICTADPEECQGAGTFTSIGDDYTLAGGSYMRLGEFRFRGGVSEPNEVVVFEFYDSSFSPPRLVNAIAQRFPNPGIEDYRIIVDCYPNCDLFGQPQGSLFEEEAFDPPFIIPPAGFVVMRASRAVSVTFKENDANAFWSTSVSAPEVGTNNDTSMWVNGVVGNNGALGLDVLAFDMVGQPLSNPPTAACCNPSTNICANTLQWDCAFCSIPPYLACTTARDCGLDNNSTCTDKYWKGAKTKPQVENDANRDCLGHYCFDPADPNPDVLTTCTGFPGQGTCLTGQTCDTPCEKAACCTPSGCIEVTTVGQCTAASGTILGFGERCTPNCCPQPNSGVDCCKDFYTCSGMGAVGCNFQCSISTGRRCTEDFECPTGETCTVLPGTVADCPVGQTCNLACDGPNGLADPRIQNIDVPTYFDGTEVAIMDFQGTTGGAVFIDDCSLSEKGWYQMFTIGKVDPTDTCAVVIQNFCCSDPEIVVGSAISRSCPCSGGETIFADNDALGSKAGAGAACNNEFCCTDNNVSIQWTLQPGTYIQGIPSAKICSNSNNACLVDADCDPGTWCILINAKYQGHMFAKPCPPAACCGMPADPPIFPDPPVAFCSVVDRFTCANERKFCKATGVACSNAMPCGLGDVCLPGVFLGLKIVSPVPECVGDPCTLGACCVSPGVCNDNNGTGINFADCALSGGAYVGGFRCIESPCPICPIETQDQCQTATTGQFILPADRIIGVRRADDFKPVGTLIKRICFFPCFIGVTATTQGFECNAGALVPPDNFVAKFYEDDLINPGKPGLLVAGVPANGFNLTIDGKRNSATNGGSRCWRYTAAINPPSGLSVTPGDCLWIEVTGLGENQANGLCLLHQLSSADGNNYSMRDVSFPPSYDLSDFDKNDLAFCIDSGIEGATSPPFSQDGGCGDFPVACCRPLGVCQSGGTYSNCVGTTAAPANGFPFPFVTCAQITCPFPPNDLCGTAPTMCSGQTPNSTLGVCSVSEGPPNIQEVCDTNIGLAPRHDCASSVAVCGGLPANSDGYRCQFASDNRLATTDGPPTAGGATGANCSSPPCASCSASGPQSFQADIWYKYTAPCDGQMTIHSCGPNKTYDSMLQVYNNPLAPATCVPCTPTDNALSQSCSDDNCGTSSSGSSLRIPVAENGCYLIRYGGWSQLGSTADAAQNVSGLDIGVVCAPVFPTQTPLAALPPHDRRKNRYISFRPNNGVTSVAFRVTKPLVAATAGFCTTSGAACTGAPLQGNCANGQLCNAPHPGGTPAGTCWVQTPVTAVGNDQFTATCGALPVFRVWPEPVIHVGDCEIIPAVDYTIFANSAGPTENPVGLAVSTTLMGFVNGKKWADSVGAFNGVEWTPPNQIGNVADILAILARISGATGRPEFVVMNLAAGSSADACVNSPVNVADTLAAVQAVGGATFGPPSATRFTTFAQCAGPPTITCSCCGN